MSKKKQTKF